MFNVRLHIPTAIGRTLIIAQRTRVLWSVEIGIGYCPHIKRRFYFQHFLSLTLHCFSGGFPWIYLLKSCTHSTQPFNGKWSQFKNEKKKMLKYAIPEHIILYLPLAPSIGSHHLCDVFPLRMLAELLSRSSRNNIVLFSKSE